VPPVVSQLQHSGLYSCPLPKQQLSFFILHFATPYEAPLPQVSSSMVRVLCPPRPTYSNTQVAGFYFRLCHNGNDEVTPEYFRCRCGTVRKQTHRNGYSNLMEHVHREHSDYEAVMLDASAAELGSLINFVLHSALKLYGWMVWIVQCNLPLAFCESREARR
jgi:hypothetical protein